MNTLWLEFLRESGARVEAGVVAHFGDPMGERGAARAGSVLADLSHLSPLEFTGEDSGTFLQGQLSCDVSALGPGGAVFGGYCAPNGRMLADFLLVRDSDAYLMLLSRSLAALIQKRLSMYVLRSRVRIADSSDSRILLGVSGAAAHEALSAYLGHEFQPGIQDEGCVIVEVPCGRKLLILSISAAEGAWRRLRTRLMPVGSGCWEWLDIRNGIPLITAATQDRLVPQMANLELLGGVSFTKGCYTGQEVVARTQHLGKVKRRMFLARTESEPSPAPGDELFSDDLSDQASGLVVNAQPSPDGGYDLLAVAQVSSKESSTVRLKAPDGPALRFESLPYELA